MNNTEIKTRHGLILQTVTKRALEQADFAYIENYQYDEVSEVPDFLIPDAEKPRFIVEVHQTEARNSFQMKTLRGFTAVTESKVHYWDDLVSVNVLFGDPENEVPESNLKALCGYFDLNIVPRYAADDRTVIEELEAISLRFAATEDVSVSNGASQTGEECPLGIAELARILRRHLRKGKANPSLKKLWQSERKRARKLGTAPVPGEHTYYKRNILRSLFFTDKQFRELITKEDPADYSQELRGQLVRCKLATIEEQIWGDELDVDSEFADFLKDPDASRLHNLCEAQMNKNREMKCFFADIREKARLVEMCRIYIRQRNENWGNIDDLLLTNLENDHFEGIDHCRCWIADILARELGVSHNRLNREMAQLGYDTENLGNPFNQISYKSSRFMGKKDKHAAYCVGVKKAAQNLVNQSEVIIENDPILLSDRLLELRLDGVIKLQKLNPLCLVLESICRTLGLAFSYSGTKSIISDLAGAARSVGKFDLFHISNGHKKIIANAIAVKDQNGDHKSKEWGARRRAVGYRLKDGKVRLAEFDEAVFILDGDWEAKHVERLHRAGWNCIIRLDQVENTFREIFGIPAEKEIEIQEEPLPLAAEEDSQLKKDKRKDRKE